LRPRALNYTSQPGPLHILRLALGTAAGTKPRWSQSPLPVVYRPDDRLRPAREGPAEEDAGVCPNRTRDYAPGWIRIVHR